MKKQSIIRIVVITVAILLIPLVAMQFTEEVNWTLSDFVIAGLLISGTCTAFELLSRSRNMSYKLAVGVAIITGFLLIWINLAVGFVGSGPNLPNIMYGFVPFIGLFGAIMSHPDPRRMSNVAFATAAAQALVPIIALLIKRPDLNENPGIIGVFVLNSIFVGLWVASALLFRRAASQPGKTNLAA